MVVESPAPVEKTDNVIDVEKTGGAGGRGDRALAWGLVAAVAAVFWPVSRWLVAEATARSQIQQGAILLAAAAGLVYGN